MQRDCTKQEVERDEEKKKKKEDFRGKEIHCSCMSHSMCVCVCVCMVPIVAVAHLVDTILCARVFLISKNKKSLSPYPLLKNTIEYVRARCPAVFAPPPSTNNGLDYDNKRR